MFGGFQEHLRWDFVSTYPSLPLFRRPGGCGSNLLRPLAYTCPNKNWVAELVSLFGMCFFSASLFLHGSKVCRDAYFWFIKCIFGNKPLEIISGDKHVCFEWFWVGAKATTPEAAHEMKQLTKICNWRKIWFQLSNPPLVPKLQIYSHVFCIPRSGTT